MLYRNNEGYINVKYVDFEYQKNGEKVNKNLIRFLEAGDKCTANINDFELLRTIAENCHNNHGTLNLFVFVVLLACMFPCIVAAVVVPSIYIKLI